MAYTYERRNELAREKGFASYSEYRRATETANRSVEFQRLIGTEVGGRDADPEDLEMARAFFLAFKKGGENDYSIRTDKNGEPIIGPNGEGAKAWWLIKVAGYVDDAAEWKQRYPNGVRHG